MAALPSPLLSPELVKSFDENGFVVTPALLTDEELGRYSATVDAQKALDADFLTGQ